MNLACAWRLGSVRGIPIELHWTFLLLWALILLGGPGPLGAAAVLRSLVVLALVVASIVLHELGHALVARGEGISTLSITFYPIGGVARMASAEVQPGPELRIAAAGPAVSLVLAALLGAAAPLHPLLGEAALLNLAIALFNLVPAFPLDGGRILRAALALRLPYARATHLATAAGKSFGFLLVVTGTLFEPLWIAFGAFILVSAALERRNLRLREALGRAHVADAMSAVGPVFDSGSRLADLVLPARVQSYYAVVEPTRGQLVGLVRRSSLEAALAAGGAASIGSLLLRTHMSTHPNALLGAVYPAMEQLGQEAVPVLFGRSVVGILSWGDLNRFARAELVRLHASAGARRWQLW